MLYDKGFKIINPCIIYSYLTTNSPHIGEIRLQKIFKVKTKHSINYLLIFIHICIIQIYFQYSIKLRNFKRVKRLY